MGLTDLANELLLEILYSCSSVKDALNLGATCHRLHRVSHGANRLPILYAAAEAQLGPLPDAIRLVTHNASQLVHLPRPPPLQSLALLQRLLAVGRVANEFVLIYPEQKWRGALSSSRRLLTTTEAYRLRRAIYRLWLYTKAFHNSTFMGQSRLQPPIIRSRAALLRPFTASELAEMLDVHGCLRSLVAYHICPSDETMRRRHKARFPNDPHPAIIPSQRKNSSALWMELEYQTQFHHSSPNMLHALSKRQDSSCYSVSGWGDEISHYYVMEDMLKLAPDQIIWLYEHVSGAPGTSGVPEDAHAWLTMSNPIKWLDGKVSKGHFARSDGEIAHGFVEAATADWFENNGETLGETVDFVVEERGGEKEAFRDAVLEGELGVVMGAYV